jgi:AcrR family transcriptional regulator
VTDDRQVARKAGLSREAILHAALRLADDEGVDGLSMRKLAEAFGATAMALYRHVAHKDDLLDGMVDLIFGEIEVPRDVGWRTAMRHRAISMREALRRHSWAVDLMEARQPGPANLRYHNTSLACLREEAGLPIREAIDAYNLMDSYIYGFALQEKTLPGDIAAEAKARRDALNSADPSLAEQFPYLIEVVNELAASGYDYTKQFERGLHVVLDGIERTSITDRGRRP